MQRNFLRPTLICLIPLLLAGWASWVAYQKYTAGEGGFKLGVDLVGGTILVYEVDPSRTELLRGATKNTEAPVDPNASSGQPQNGGLSKDDMQQLAAALKRRIDPTDLKNVTIRPVGNTRIEIILPAGGAAEGAKAGEKSAFTEEEIREVRRLVSQVGTLEFRILANNEDDKEAVDAARGLIDGMTPEQKSELAQRAAPPPAPEGTFDVRGLSTTYAWLELAKEERMTLELNNDRELETATTTLWQQVAAARNEGRAYPHSLNANGRATSMLIYSRKCEVPNQALREDKKYEYWVLTRVEDRVRVEKPVSVVASVGTSSDYKIAVDFRFNSEGARQFRRLTARNQPTSLQGSDTKVMRHLAIVLDGMIKSAPTINSVIESSGQITGNYTREDAAQLVHILKSGALSAVLKPDPVSEYSIGPTLGAETIRSGTRAVGMAFVAILLFMCVYYRFAGFVATVALFANLLLTIGFMVLVNATFTLPGLAGLVLMLGMAVDANVLIYERVREERERGASLLVGIRNGYDRAFPTIIDTHLSSIFTAIILYAVGNDQLKGFGISLTVGLVISLFTSLYMTRLMFDFWLSRRWLTNLKMFKFFTRPNIDFMAIRKPMFALTGVLTILGITLFLLRGRDGLNIDFLGGTAYTGVLKPGKEMEIEDLRKLLAEDHQKDKLKVDKVEPVKDEAGKLTNQWKITYQGDPEVIVTLANAPAEDTEAVRQALAARVSRVPDWSMEQIFDSKSEGTKSSLFTVRTTEREQELVKVMVNRLFEEGNDSLLKRTTVKAEPLDKDNRSWRLKFFGPDGEPQPASASYLQSFIKNVIAAQYPQYRQAQLFDIVGEGTADQGRYSALRLNFVRDTDNVALKDPNTIATLVTRASEEFTKRPQPERLENVDETLADDMKLRALYAILASWLAILGYLWFRFGNWTFGASAVLCLIHDLCFTLGAIAACHYLHDTAIGKALLLQDFKIDLPAIAALLTLVGYSVNDTIVVFDRIREVRGKSPKLTAQMINESVNQTLSRTLLTSLTIFLVSIVLYIFGGEGVHLFAFVMVLGVIVGTYSSIYIASPLLLIFKEGSSEDRDFGRTPKTPEPEATTEDEVDEEAEAKA